MKNEIYGDPFSWGQDQRKKKIIGYIQIDSKIKIIFCKSSPNNANDLWATQQNY